MNLSRTLLLIALSLPLPALASDYVELAAAIKAGDRSRVGQLLDAGVAPDAAPPPEKSPPLVLAVALKHHDIARELLARGADPDARHATYYNATALMLAVNARDAALTRLLLDAGASVNLTDKAGDSALNWATFYGDAEIAELLLARGIDASLYGHGNALDVAMRRGHQGLVQRYTDYLGRRRAVAPRDQALFDAIDAGQPAALRAALAAGASIEALDGTHRGALAAAARRGDVALVAALLDAGADIERADPIGFTPLLEAARDGHADVVALLLERGASLGHRAAANGLQLTALHLATASGQVETVELLVQRGAPIDAVDSEHATPLLWATNQQPAVAVRLVELGADADIAPKDGSSPRQIATERKMDALLAALAARGS